MEYFNMLSAEALILNYDTSAYAITFCILTAAAITDIRERIIPDSLIIAGAAIGLTLKLYGPMEVFFDGLLGGLTAGSVLLLIYYIAKGGLGLGDVKLFGCTGIYLGFESIISAMLISALLSGLFSLVLICMSRNNKKREIPFAPFILAGALAAVLL